jgi:hypothetical protein
LLLLLLLVDEDDDVVVVAVVVALVPAAVDEVRQSGPAESGSIFGPGDGVCCRKEERKTLQLRERNRVDGGGGGGEKNKQLRHERYTTAAVAALRPTNLTRQ